MACPFSRGFGKARFEDEGKDRESAETKEDDASRTSRPRRTDRVKPSRQSSVQITSSLLGEEIEEEEDTQTLNLKHLRAAVLVLTNPSVYLIWIYYLEFVNY